MGTLNIRIPSEIKNQIDQLSAQQHRSTSDLVRESLRRYIVSEQLKSVRRMTLPLAEAQGYLTDEDIFEDIS